MACLKVQGPLGIRILPEGPDGNIRGKSRDEVIIGPVWDCGPRRLGDGMDMESVFTKDGFMVGNLIRKTTKALRLNHCFKCTGRQRHYNQKGLEIQQTVKEFFK